MMELAGVGKTREWKINTSICHKRYGDVIKAAHIPFGEHRILLYLGYKKKLVMNNGGDCMCIAHMRICMFVLFV